MLESARGICFRNYVSSTENSIDLDQYTFPQHYASRNRHSWNIVSKFRHVLIAKVWFVGAQRNPFIDTYIQSKHWTIADHARLPAGKTLYIESNSNHLFLSISFHRDSVYAISIALLRSLTCSLARFISFSLPFLRYIFKLAKMFKHWISIFINEQTCGGDGLSNTTQLWFTSAK